MIRYLNVDAYLINEIQWGAMNQNCEMNVRHMPNEYSIKVVCCLIIKNLKNNHVLVIARRLEAT